MRFSPMHCNLDPRQSLMKTLYSKLFYYIGVRFDCARLQTQAIISQQIRL